MEGDENTRTPKLKFTSQNLKELKDGFCAVLDIFDNILDLDPEKQRRLTCSELKDRIERVDQEKWTKVREKYLAERGEEKEKVGDIEDEEEGESQDEPGQLLLDFYDKLDLVKENLEIALAARTVKEKELSQEIKLLQQDLSQSNRTESDLKWKYDEVAKDLGIAKGTLRAIQQQLKDKQEAITQLKKDGTVQLWEKERTKLLDQVSQKEKELERELKDWKKMHEETKRRLQDKIRELDHKVKLQKMTAEVKLMPTAKEVNQDLDACKRQLYMKEKSLLCAEQELAKQQKLYAGCVIGLQRDFKIMAERQEKKQKLSENDIEKYRDLLDAVLRGAKTGKLEQLRADLPDHYIYSSNEVLGHPLGKKLSPAYKNGQLLPIQKRLVGIDSCAETTSTSGNDSSIDLHREPSPRNNGLTNNSDGKKPPAIGGHAHIHPELVDDDGKLDVAEAQKFFPHYTEDQIKDQYENFRKYDTNDDFTLDMSEMMAAMQSTIGNYYTPAQIKEAMVEVDVDSSDTIDFYEYLGVSHMLRLRAGKSEVFRSGLVRHAGNSVSKMCIVQ